MPYPAVCRVGACQRDGEPAILQLVGYPHLAPGRLLDGDIDYRPLDLRLRPVLQAGLEGG